MVDSCGDVSDQDGRFLCFSLTFLHGKFLSSVLELAMSFSARTHSSILTPTTPTALFSSVVLLNTSSRQEDEAERLKVFAAWLDQNVVKADATGFSLFHSLATCHLLL